MEKDDPLLFLADGEFLDVMEQFIGIDPAEAAEAFTGGLLLALEGKHGWVVRCVACCRKVFKSAQEHEQPGAHITAGTATT